MDFKAICGIGLAVVSFVAIAFAWLAPYYENRDRERHGRERGGCI